MAVLESEQLWQRAFPHVTRPLLYVDDDVDEDGFRPLTDPQHFITDISEQSQLQLYASSANNQLALHQAQAEYLDISRQIAALKGKEPKAKNPQELQQPDEFEDRKEASLYNYKYEANRPALIHNGVIGNRAAEDITDQEKRDVRLFQNPFEQGGFVPTDRQYKALVSKAINLKNIDGWNPIEKARKRLIPRQNPERPEYTTVYVRRNIDENGELIRPASSGTDESIATPSKVENKRLTRTRFGGKKVPPTRDASETPSFASTPGRKRAVTPSAEGRDGTPASVKRRRVNGESDRPRHPNQYTKARELAAQHAAKTGGGSGVNGSLQNSSTTRMPDWSTMTPSQLLSRKWTDEELVHSIRADHSWLHADPAKALEWRDKILNGVNPVRSWSMVKKWEEWKVTNKDKRPRKKVVVEAREGDGGGGVAMERGGSEGGSEWGRKGRGSGGGAMAAKVDRSSSATPMRRSARNR